VRIISNRGTDRAIDQIKSVTATADASAISSSVSIFGLSALQDALTRELPEPVPQSAFMLRNTGGEPALAMVGACSLTTSGLGVTPG